MIIIVCLNKNITFFFLKKGYIFGMIIYFEVEMLIALKLKCFMHGNVHLTHNFLPIHQNIFPFSLDVN